VPTKQRRPYADSSEAAQRTHGDDYAKDRRRSLTGRNRPSCQAVVGCIASCGALHVEIEQLIQSKASTPVSPLLSRITFMKTSCVILWRSLRMASRRRRLRFGSVARSRHGRHHHDAMQPTTACHDGRFPARLGIVAASLRSHHHGSLGALRRNRQRSPLLCRHIPWHPALLCLWSHGLNMTKAVEDEHAFLYVMAFS